MMAALDDWSVRLGNLKNAWNTASTPEDKTTIANAGTKLRKDALAEGVDLNQLEDLSRQTAGIKPTMNGKQDAAWRKKTFDPLKSSFQNPTSPGAGSETGTPSGGGPVNFSDPEAAGALTTQFDKLQEMISGYKYDYTTDPAYLAAVQQAQEGAKAATDNTVATMADRGILNSSVTSNQLGQIEQMAKTEPLKMLPQLEANAFNRFQQGVSNQFNMLGYMMDQEKFNADEHWKTEDAAFREAEMDGTYMSPEAKSLIESIIKAKQDYPGAGTAEDRTAIMKSATDARAALAALGYDSSLFGGNVNLQSAMQNVGKASIETAASKRDKAEADYQDRSFKLDEKRVGLDERRLNWDMSKPRGGSGGGSGGGMTFAQTRDANTDGMLLKMRLDGVDTPEEGMAWIQKNLQDILAGNVDPGKLLTSIDATGKSGSSSGSGKTPYEVHMDARKMAQEDPEWDQAIDEVTGLPDRDKQNALIKRYEDELSAINNPAAAAATGGSEGWSDGTLLHKIKWKDSLY